MSRQILHAHITGEGEPIVLLHGYLSSSQYFKHVRQKLEANHTVIALDLLGFGRSFKPRVDYTYEDHMTAIKSTLEHLGVKKPFILLGHSMGALIALRYATNNETSVKKLLLFNPPLFTDKTQMVEHHKATGRRYRIMLYSRGRHVYWLSLRLLPKNTSNRRRAINFSDIISVSPHAREGSYKNIIAGANIFQDFRKVTIPTLLVNGYYDRAVYLQNLQGRNLPSNVTAVTMESGHHPLVRNVSEAELVINTYLTME